VANQPLISNYGERWRNEETIATGFVESAVNQIVSKRFVKKQQMQWTKKGAHLLLQIAPKCSMSAWKRPSEAGIRPSALLRTKSRRRLKRRLFLCSPTPSAAPR
jgi:hypothetical protein